LTLQIVNRSEVYNYLNILYSLNETKLDIETRSPLDEALAREWAFDKINAFTKGRKIKKWAAKTGKACPGALCNHIKFGKAVGLELKYPAAILSVKRQILGYKKDYEDKSGKTDSRFMVIAPKIPEKLKLLLVNDGIEYREIEF